ncbi:transporter substrate-binding domain-containing protein [Rheinheimera baltica]|nr:transporter substrate-binding domain-containing protein [Rheinheimera baltica]
MIVSCLRILIIYLALLATSVKAAEILRVGLHLSAPWSFYNDAGALDGIEYQLMSRIFSQAGYQVEFELHSYSRLLKQFSDHKLDCISPAAVDIAGAIYTQPYLPFKDVAISLQQAAITLNSVSDLSGKRIVAYQQAEKILGQNYQHAISEASYLELAERKLQLELLFSHRVDLVIGEQRVLHYLANKVAPQQPLETHYLFNEALYPAACWQAEWVTVFNRGLAQLQQSGKLKQLLLQYLPN